MSGKKGMKLRAWGTLRRLPSGNWQASYCGPDLARHVAPITFSARMDGEYWLAAERRLIERDEWSAPRIRADEHRAKSKAFGDFATEWIETRTLKPRTRIFYESLYDRLIKPRLGNVPLSALNGETVRRWHAGLGTEHPTRNAHGYSLLRAICATAVNDGLLTVNPCQIAGAGSAPIKRQAVILEVDEIAKLVNAFKPQRLRCLLLISAWCGLRWGEVTELRRNDISPDCSVITVSRGVTHRNRQCMISTPKSGKVRKVVVPAHIREDIKHHQNTFVAESADAQLFPAAQGGCHLRDAVFNDNMKAALKAITREGMCIHDLRHFAGTQAARVGNLAEVMGRLGHSTVRASLTYQQIVNGRDAEVAEQLSALALADAGIRHTTG